MQIHLLSILLVINRYCTSIHIILYVFIVCVGEGTYAEKPGDIDDLSLPQGQVEVNYILTFATI